MMQGPTARRVLGKPNPHTTIVTSEEASTRLGTEVWYAAACLTCDWRSHSRSLSERTAARHGLMHEDDVIVDAVVGPIAEDYKVPMEPLRAAFFEGRNYGRTDV